MKRRPLLLALVLTIAAVGCIAPFWWEIWLRVAYRSIEVETSYPMWVKRTKFVPGADLYCLPQPCIFCREQYHENCMNPSLIHHHGYPQLSPDWTWSFDIWSL